MRGPVIRLTVNVAGCDVTARALVPHVPEEAFLDPACTAAMDEKISFHN